HTTMPYTCSLHDALPILPAKEYSCVRYETLKADKYGFVQVDTKKYSTSPRYAKQKVLVAITYDQVTILSDRYEKIVRHNRIYGKDRKSTRLNSSHVSRS